MSAVDLISVVVLAFVGVRLIEAARGTAEQRDHVARVVRGLRFHHFAMGFGVLVVIVLVAFVLMELPILSWGWWQALGGQGNPVFGSTESTRGSPWEWIVPVVFLALLIPALPILVEREEVMFRLGAEHRSRAKNTVRNLVFGTAHAAIGIPIGAGVALSIGGWYLTRSYLRAYRRTGSVEASVAESTRAHLAYNLVIVVLVAVAIALDPTT